MYTKNLEQLIRLLQVSRQSGLLIVEAAEPGESLWRGYIRLVQGQIRACQVRRKADGQGMLSNDEALQWLMAQGRLNWHMEEEPQGRESDGSPPPQPGSAIRESKQPSGPQRAVSSSSLPAGWIPRRTQKGALTPAHTLESLEYRRVFSLVNGHNSLEGIARLLRQPIQKVVDVLEVLRKGGLIE